MSTALLICNAEKPGRWLQQYAQKADFILAADGGADAALAAGIMPSAVIGDLDSVSLRARRLLKDTPFIHVTRQDNTDLEKALDFLVAQHFEQCIIAGATGGRLDFTLGNILAIRPYVTKINLSFQDKNWALYPVTQTLTLPAKKGARLSLLPLNKCRGVTLTGCKYPLTKENLTGRQIGRTLSNQVSAPQISVSLTSGLLLLYIETNI